jgi:hypothetical protein
MEISQETQTKPEDPLEWESIKKQIIKATLSNKAISQAVDWYKKYRCKPAPGSRFAQWRAKILERNKVPEFMVNGYHIPWRTYDPLHGSHIQNLQAIKQAQNEDYWIHQMAANQPNEEISIQLQ